MRIDKFLKNSRIIKRRTVAKTACQQGRVLVNGKEVKPGYELEIGDIVEVKYGDNTLKIKVLKLLEHVKNNADTMYEVIE